MSIEFIHFNAGCPGGNVFYVGCPIFAGLTLIFMRARDKNSENAREEILKAYCAS